MHCERIEDLPVIIQIARDTGVDLLFDKHIPPHKNRKYLSHGKLALAWIGFILSRTSHCKSHVSNWSEKVKVSLGHLLNASLSNNDFSDKRLSSLLNYLSNDEIWFAIENDLWKLKVDVYSMPIRGVRLDATTCSGYHDIQPGGIMQIGHSSNKRHDLPQLKLMGAADADKGELIAINTAPGNANDDILYVPIIRRLRGLLGNVRGLLYCGDCKMSSLETRAVISEHEDYYVTPLQLNTEKIREDLTSWIEAAVSGEQKLDTFSMKNKIIGKGYEINRMQEINRDYIKHSWEERVIINRSESLVQVQERGLEQRLKSASTKLSNLTKNKQKWKKKEFLNSVEAILDQYKVQGLLKVNWVATVKKSKAFNRTEIRNGKKRKGTYIRTEKIIRIESVEREEEEIKKVVARLGWRIHVTNAPVSLLNLEQVMVFYREEWKIEQQFHFIKDQPIGISPLYVWKDEQLTGMCRFLSVVLRIWTRIRVKVVESLENHNQVLEGIYKGVPKKKTKTPTGKIILDVFEDIILSWDKSGQCYVNLITPIAKDLLRHLGICGDIYEDLAAACTNKSI